MVGLLMRDIQLTGSPDLVTVHNGSTVKLECLSEQAIAYLLEQSLIYKVTPNRLLAALIKVVCEDQLLHATLDERNINSIIPRQRQRLMRKRRRTAISEYA